MKLSQEEIMRFPSLRRSCIVASISVKAFTTISLALFSFSPLALAQDIYVTSDATVANGNPLIGTGPTARIYVGLDNVGTLYPSIDADFIGGTAQVLQNWSDGTLNITGGSVQTITDTSNVAGGIVNVLGGNIDTVGVNLQDTVNIDGGIIRGVDVGVSGLGGGIANVTNGTITEYLNFLDGSIGNISGGNITTTYVQNGSIVNVSGGNLGSLYSFSGGGTFNITGGSISGNTLANLHAGIGIYGQFNVYGDNLSLTNPMVGEYIIPAGVNFSGVFWDLTGILQNGDVLNTRYFVQDGSVGDPIGIAFNPVSVVPELGTLALFASGAFGVVSITLRRKRVFEITRRE